MCSRFKFFDVSDYVRVWPVVADDVVMAVQPPAAGPSEPAGCGAGVWAERARAELDRISGRPLRAGALTGTEQQIAELVAAGRSNQEVARTLSLSPNAVEWNLSKIYRKLHVRLRAELAAKHARREAI